MATTKKTAKAKQAGRKGTTTRNAGKTKRAGGMPRSEKQVAAWLEARETRRTGFIQRVWGMLSKTGASKSTTSGSTGARIAQVMPRESGAGATH